MGKIANQATDEETIRSVLNWTKAHFSNELGLTLQGDFRASGDAKVLKLRGITAIMSLGGATNVLTAFSFDAPLAQYLLEKEIRNCGLSVSEEDMHQLMLDALAETINVILGNCTVDLAKHDNPVILSTPLVIEEGGRASTPRGSFFSRISYMTDYGPLDVVFITPHHLRITDLAA